MTTTDVVFLNIFANFNAIGAKNYDNYNHATPTINTNDSSFKLAEKKIVNICIDAYSKQL